MFRYDWSKLNVEWLRTKWFLHFCTVYTWHTITVLKCPMVILENHFLKKKRTLLLYDILRVRHSFVRSYPQEIEALYVNAVRPKSFEITYINCHVLVVILSLPVLQSLTLSATFHNAFIEQQILSGLNYCLWS